MMQRRWNRRRTLALVATNAAALIFCLALLAGPGLGQLGYGQSFAGRWAATGQPLHNGELHKSILDLTQNGSELKGKLVALGYGVDVEGTASGNHFELYAWEHKKPIIVGDLVNGELHYMQWGGAFVAHPATAADEFPKLPYLEPPALHKVPYNGLAKTPPMGWNSWNLFAEKIDDKTVRTMADAMVAAGCATRAMCM
jgi:alpha-galactosidase